MFSYCCVTETDGNNDIFDVLTIGSNQAGGEHCQQKHLELFTEEVFGSHPYILCNRPNDKNNQKQDDNIKYQLKVLIVIRKIRNILGKLAVLLS